MPDFPAGQAEFEETYDSGREHVAALSGLSAAVGDAVPVRIFRLRWGPLTISEARPIWVALVKMQAGETYSFTHPHTGTPWNVSLPLSTEPAWRIEQGMVIGMEVDLRTSAE